MPHGLLPGLHPVPRMESHPFCRAKLLCLPLDRPTEIAKKGDQHSAYLDLLPCHNLPLHLDVESSWRNRHPIRPARRSSQPTIPSV